MCYNICLGLGNKATKMIHTISLEAATDWFPLVNIWTHVSEKVGKKLSMGHRRNKDENLCLGSHRLLWWWWWLLSCVWLFVTLWMVACHAPLSMGFLRQEYWSGDLSSSRGSFWPRDRTHISCVSCTGKQMLYHCTTWEAQTIRDVSSYVCCC